MVQRSNLESGSLARERAPGLPPPLRGPLALSGSGERMDAALRQSFEQRFGHSLDAIRIHTDDATATHLRQAGANAVALGPHIGFAPQKFAPRSAAGARLLAHELTHVIQQDPAGAGRLAASGPVAAEREAARNADTAGAGANAPLPVGLRAPTQPQFDLEDPGRLATVHGNVFPAAPTATSGGGGASTASSRPWVPASATSGGTAALIKQQVRDAVQRLVDADSDEVAEPPIRSSEADIDRDVLVANTRLRAHFPQISVTVSDAELQTAAGVLSRVETDNPSFQHQWLWNMLPNLSDIADFAINFGDADAITLRTDLLADRSLGPRLRTMSRRVAGLQTGTGTGRVIRINRGVDAQTRGASLVHELVHMFADDAYTRWVATTANEDLYGEGITEWLARLVMTPDERALPTGYTSRRQRVEREIVPHVSEDDIARAYFQGEVWRLESRSDIARERFEADSGIEAGATGRRESDQSRAGPGLTQEVLPDAHYRFLNLGNDSADPKPEHVDYFRGLKTRLLDPQPGSVVKFIGHASSPGPAAHNERLSLRRVQAFYRMARDQGLDASRLRDETPPEHHGEQLPTLTEEDAQTRAFNRRVELRLSGVSGSPGRSSGSPSTTAPAREEDR